MGAKAAEGAWREWRWIVRERCSEGFGVGGSGGGDWALSWWVGGVCVDLPGGARMEIGDGSQLALAAELLCALAARDFTGAVRC